jgi:DNA polymerase-1
MNNRITHISFDYETTKLSPYLGGEVFTYILFNDMGDFSIFDKEGNKNFKKDLQNYFNDITKSKICHNFKFELKYTQFTGISIPVNTIWHDTMIMSKLLNNLWMQHSLDILAFNLCGYPTDIDKQVEKIGKKYGYDKVPKELMHEYQRRDGERCMLLFKTFYPYILKEYSQQYNMEIEISKISNEMENEGILIDKRKTLDLIKWLENELYKLDCEIYQEYGEHLNFSRQVICKRILELKLKKKIDTTDKDLILKERAEKPIKELDWIIKKRSYTGGKTLLKAYLDFCGNDGKVHTNINTIQARTGRQSSNSPSLMNMSKEISLKNIYPIPSRKIIIPGKGFIFIDADWKGIEMRLGVQGANSKRLIDLLHKNFDFHTDCAINFYGDRFINEKNDIVKMMLRSAAKNGRFAMFYGAGIEQVAITLQLPIEAATVGVEKDRKKYPELYDFMDECIQFAKEHGYIYTFFGRKLQVLKSKCYVATDYKIQGTAAEIMKIAQVRIFNLLQRTWKSEIKMILPIHDQILFKYPIKLLSYLQDFLNDINPAMIQFKEIKVPLEIEYKKAIYNWNNTKEIIREKKN